MACPQTPREAAGARSLGSYPGVRRPLLSIGTFGHPGCADRGRAMSSACTTSSGDPGGQPELALMQALRPSGNRYRPQRGGANFPRPSPTNDSQMTLDQPDGDDRRPSPDRVTDLTRDRSDPLGLDDPRHFDLLESALLLLVEGRHDFAVIGLQTALEIYLELEVARLLEWRRLGSL